MQRGGDGEMLNHEQILEVCYKAGVTHVTIYAFSIENFKRSKYEVDALMDMAKIKLTQLSQHGDLMDQYGASIRILGQRELVKPDVLEAIDKAVEMTSRNGNAVLNVCFPYTSRDEMTTAVRRTVDEWSKPLPEKIGEGPFKEDRIAQNIRKQNKSNGNDTQTYLSPPKSMLSPSSSTTSLSSNGDSTNNSPSSLSSTTTLHHPASPPLLATDLKHPLVTPPQHPTSRTLHHSTYYPSPESITSSTLTSHMFTADNPSLDLLVRTSCVHRLSDFMLWQCHQNTEIAFLDVLWPEFDLWSFLPVLWEWQWRQKKLKSEERAGKSVKGRERSNSRIRADRKKTVSGLLAESLD
jgi:ditrans,polycis-polyprenyl diphosphate synthase